MHELQFLRVQQVTAITGQAGMTLQATAGFIQRITEQRVAGIGHVNADLVRPAGRDLDTEQGLIVALFQDDRHAMRRLAAGARCLHRADQWMRHRANRHVDHEHLGARRAKSDGAIDLFHRVIAPRARQR